MACILNLNLILLFFFLFLSKFLDMYREKIKDLIQWKDKSNRKPLIVNGSRQVGKSWLIKSFGENYFKNHFIEINLERSKDLHEVFKKNYDVKRIVFELSLLLNTPIDKDKDLIFIDEIQSCPEALGVLRYFYEDMPELHVIVAGSLLDFEFRNMPFPVGRVETMSMYPMSFYEFLLARNKKSLADLLTKNYENIPDEVNHFFEDEFNFYLVVGGLPECVKYFTENNDLLGLSKIQDDLLYSYREDFKKYKPAVDTECLLDILENISKSVGSQTIYSKLSERFSNPTIKKGVNVLKTAQLIHHVQNVSVSSLPLTASGKQFKNYFLDVGLLLRISKIDYKSLITKNDLSPVYKGLLAEQFVAQQLICSTENQVNYWSRTDKGASSEVDFVIFYDNQIIPIEVKIGKTGSLKSLHYILENYQNIQKAIVYSTTKKGVNDKIQYIPIYFAGMFNAIKS